MSDHAHALIVADEGRHTRLLAAVMEQLPLGVVLLNENSEIIYRNQRALEIVPSQAKSHRDNLTSSPLPQALQDLLAQAQGSLENISTSLWLGSFSDRDHFCKVSVICLTEALGIGEAHWALVLEEPACQQDLLKCPSGRMWSGCEVAQ